MLHVEVNQLRLPLRILNQSWTSGPNLWLKWVGKGGWTATLGHDMRKPTRKKDEEIVIIEY
jgi:hypothetical protein